MKTIQTRLTPEGKRRYEAQKALANDDVIQLALYLQHAAFASNPPANLSGEKPAPVYLSQATEIMRNEDLRLRIQVLIEGA